VKLLARATTNISTLRRLIGGQAEVFSQEVTTPAPLLCLQRVAREREVFLRWGRVIGEIVSSNRIIRSNDAPLPSIA